MRTKSVYEVIKKQNGEAFAQSIRRFDSGLFEIPDLPYIVKYAGDMAEPLLDFLEMFKNIKVEEEGEAKDPFILLKQAGYKAFVADTSQKQNAIWHYFDKDERICTFDDPWRYQNYFIIYAVKEGAEKLNRADFLNPSREDVYATSVISIQIAKRGGFIKITNRYNHTVEYPDNTFNSNPDNIIKGLSSALKHYFQVDFSSVQQPLPEGYLFVNGAIVSYDYEQNGIFFSDTHYVKDGEIIEINKDYQFIFDRFILDLKQKKVLPIVDTLDSLPYVLEEEFKTKKRLLIRKKSKYTWSLYGDSTEIMTVEYNRLRTLFLSQTRELKNLFLAYKSRIKKFEAPNLVIMGRKCLSNSPELEVFITPQLRVMEEGCINSSVIRCMAMPSVRSIQDNCFSNQNGRVGKMPALNLPLLKVMGNRCFNSYNIGVLSLSSCEKIGDYFGSCYVSPRLAYLPSLNALPKNSSLSETKKIHAPFLVQKSKNKILNLFVNVLARAT